MNSSRIIQTVDIMILIALNISPKILKRISWKVRFFNITVRVLNEMRKVKSITV